MESCFKSAVAGSCIVVAVACKSKRVREGLMVACFEACMAAELCTSRVVEKIHVDFLACNQRNEGTRLAGSK